MVSSSRDRRRGVAPPSSRRPPAHTTTTTIVGVPDPVRGFGRGQVVEIQRARMLGAMVEACMERGVGNVTVAQVVARAGVSRRTFYEQFRDLEDCFLATFDHALDCAAAVVIPAYEAQDAWREQVRAGLIALLAFLEDEPAQARLLVVDILGAGPKALQRRGHVLSILIETIQQGRTQRVEKNKDESSLTAEGIVGAVFSVIHARLLQELSPVDGGASRARGPCTSTLKALTNPLMSVIVMPYLGQATARAELERATPKTRRTPSTPRANPLRDLDMRLTYRTARVLNTIAEHPGASNRQVGEHAGIHDQGQISKLLARLHRLELIRNTTPRHTNRGGPNAWTLTSTGREIHNTITMQTGF
jgi:AcrR family transcriptional regulator